MKKPDWDRIQEIYHEARELPSSERRAFVEKAAGDDTVLAREVIHLLALNGESFLKPPAVNLPLTSSADNLVGATIGDRYFIERELGHGGMSRVYFARDLKVNCKNVVVKILSQQLLEHLYARQKFEQEVEALARIRHPDVVEVFDKGELDDGRPYFVMQFIDGKDLRSQITSGGMNLEHAATILKQIGAALDHVHENGVFHRDLKPENIMLTRGTDSVVLIDFGIAKVRDSVVAPTTTDGQSAGTLMYMSPEQLRGQTLTCASDIYSMGVIAYEIVTGRRPFNPTTPSELLECQRSGVDVKPVALRRNLPPKAQDVILRGLSFKPASRYSNAKQFGDDLSVALLTSRIAPKKTSWIKVMRAPLLILLGVALIFSIYKIIDGPREPNRSFNYFLTVQKMRDGQPYHDPFRSHGDEIYENGDRFRLTVSTPVPAYFYIFKEAPPLKSSDTSFKMIYPPQANDEGAASLGADQPFASEWFTFTGPAGAENFWLVWSTEPVVELNSMISKDSTNPDGNLSRPTLVVVKQYLIAKKAEINATTYNYNANQTAVVRARRDLLVTLAQFKHR